MRTDHILPILLIFLLSISTIIAGRFSISDDINSSSEEFEGKTLLFEENIVFFSSSDLDRDNFFNKRGIFPSSSASQSREQLLNLLRKAYHDGWKPNIKHYIPATRFGRQNR